MPEAKEVELDFEEVRSLVENKEWKHVKNLLSELPPSKIIEIMEGFDLQTQLLILRLLARNNAAEVFSKLGPDRQESILKTMNNNQIKQVITELSPDDRTEVFGDLPGKLTQKLLNILPLEERREALALLGYPEDSVGRLMTPDYVAVRSYWKVGRALEHIRERGKDAETIDIVYVTGDNWQLLDSLAIRKFILADPEHTVESIMDYTFVAITVYEDQEQAVKKMSEFDLVALPVIDSDNILLGIVTIDDILDVLEEETTEDFHKGAAIAPVGIQYTTASPWTLYVKRITWLSILLLAGFISSTIISRFEATLNSVIALTFFIPILIGSGGNTATQSATLIIRAISTGDLTLRKWFRVAKKEIITGLLLGVSLGVLLFLRSLLFKDGFSLGLTLGLSTISVVLLANLVGALLPIILTKMRLDPAVISSPLLTTLIDAAGLLIYFSIANLVYNL
ncbi:MAG: magnesium transporter [Actinomycetota bacterium]